MRIARPPRIFATTLVSVVLTASLSACGQPSPEVSAPPAVPLVSTATASPAVEVEPAVEAPAAASTSAPEAEPTSEAAPASDEDEDALVASDDRLVIERLGVDVPLRSFTPQGGVADPPTWTDAWLADLYGSPSDPDSGTSIVFLHSGIREPDAVGNRLLDRDAHASTLRVGDVLKVDGSGFNVTSTHVLSKDAVEAGAKEVWLNEDGRLILITCLARPGERKAVDVIAVVAQRRA